MSKFHRKRFVVTVRHRGIGQAAAEKLLVAGAEVIALDHDTPTVAVTRHIEVDLANPRSIDAPCEPRQRCMPQPRINLA